MKRFYVFFVIFFIPYTSFSRTQEIRPDSSSQVNSVAYVDIMLLGAGIYNETILSNHFSFKFGCNFVCFGEAYTAVSIPIMYNYFSSSSSGFEAGLGVGCCFLSSTFSIGGSMSNPSSYIMLFPAISLGYRYHDKQKNKFYRVGVELPANFCFLLHFSFGL